MNKAFRYLIVVIITLGLATLACGSDQSGEKVDEKEVATKPPPKVETYKAGDVIKVKEHTIVLNEATISAGILKANFTVENKGSEDLNVSSLLSFNAKDDEGSKLEQEIFDCDTSSLDGTVLPGDKLKGSICYKGATATPIKIYYEASLLGSGAVVWEVSE